MTHPFSLRSARVAAVIFVFAAVSTRASEFTDLEKQGERNFATPEGRRYLLGPFDKAFLPRFSKALTKCSLRTPDTKEPATLVFVIAADGKVKRILHTPGIPLGECLAAELQSFKTVPPPPHDSWVVAF